jgi:hypothetical protein
MTDRGAAREARVKPSEALIARRVKRIALRTIDALPESLAGDPTAAGNHLRSAVRFGRIIPPEVCEICGLPPKDGQKLHGHHWSYESEHRKDVCWCCAKHHKAIHGMISLLIERLSAP